MTKQEAIELVTSGPSSILTREDVLNLLNDIEAGDTQPDADMEEADDDTVIQIKRGKLLDMLEECLSNELDSLSLEEEADVSLSMEYDNHIRIESVDWDTSGTIDSFIDNVKGSLDEYINDKAK